MNWRTVVLIALGTYLLMWAASCNRDAGLRYPNLPLPADATVRAGDPIPLTVERCNDTGKPLTYSVARTLVRLSPEPKTTTVMAGTTTVVPPGCETTRSLLNIIPAGTPPGTYEIRAVSSFLYRDRRREVGWTTTPFDVTAP